MEESLQKKLNQLVKKLSSYSFVDAIYLFGSHATGKARQDSDIDLAILINKPTRKKELTLIGYTNKLFEVHPMQKLPLVIQFRVIKEGKLLFARNEKAIHYHKVNIIRSYLDFAPFIHRLYRRALHV